MEGRALLEEIFMYEIKIISHFSAAHQLKDFTGRCERLHGHNWKVEAYLRGKELNKDGMLLDFRILKDTLNRVLNRFDHQFLNELPEFKDRPPSTENIAHLIFKRLKEELHFENVRVSKVSVWESEDSCATYQED